MPSSHSNQIVLQTDQLEPLLDQPDILPVFVGSEQAFLQAHIPGSVLIQPQQLVNGTAPAPGAIASPNVLSEVFSAIGLSEGTVVIAYDDEGGGWAGRLIWTLDIVGHANYHYLDGGLIAWAGENRALEAGPQTVGEVTNYPVLFDSSQLVSIPHIIEHLNDNDMAIWDARSAEEHRGEKVLALRGGHIPGAANMDWLLLMDQTNYLRLKPLAEIEKSLAGIGIDKSKRVITHCQTHHRSGLSYLVGKILGLNIKAYDGSWSEWGNRQDTPIEN